MGVKIGKAYSSVVELLKGEYPDEPELAESFIKTHKREMISNYLWMMRTRSGVTQEEMAKRLGVSQSKIAKMEDKGDNVRMNDVIDFAQALGYNTTLQFNEGNMASRLRWHLEAVIGTMTELERIAANDKDIISGVFKHFASETQKMLDNVVPHWMEKLDKLEKDEPSSVIPHHNPVHVEIHTSDASAVLSAEPGE